MSGMPPAAGDGFPGGGDLRVFDNGPRYDRCAETAATIVNLYLNSSKPKTEIFGCILFTILRTVYAIEEDLGWRQLEPSEN